MTNLVDTFLNQLTAEEKRSKTREQYGGNLRRFERWLQETHSLLLTKEQIGVVTGLMLTEFYQHLHAQGLKASTRNAYVIALMEFFRFLQNAQVISDNPARVLHTVKEKKKSDADEHKQHRQRISRPVFTRRLSPSFRHLYLLPPSGPLLLVRR